ncbi:MAG: hypothetical protein VB858_09765 [Planctomycetaceae bacterium]
MRAARDQRRDVFSCSVTERSGFSLLEVILATAILMGSAVVLSRLAWMGRTQSRRAETNAEAHQLCEQILSEVLLGLRSTDTVEQEPFWPSVSLTVDPADSAGSLESDLFGDSRSVRGTDGAELSQTGEPLWLHTIRIEPHQRFPGLSVLTVEVIQRRQASVRPARIRLIRWIHDSVPEQQSGVAVARRRNFR